MRVGITALIASCKEMEAVAQAGSGEEALKLHALHHPDITLMDLRLPGISGVETIRRIRAQSPKARFIILTTYEGDEDILSGHGGRSDRLPGQGHAPGDAGQCGASKFTPEAGICLRPCLAGAGRRALRDSTLSSREREVLGLVAKGNSNREIAVELGITEATVKCHVSVILMRLNASDRTQAVVTALQRGLIHI